MSRISCIGIIAPAASLKEGEEERLLEGVKFLEELGLKVKRADNLYDREELFPGAGTYLPGNAERRIESMMKLWSDTSVHALLAMRGGYGCIQLLDKLDYNYMAKQAKPIFGYSDLTALFCAIYTQAYKSKLELFHTPMLLELTKLNARSRDSFVNMLSSIDYEAYGDYDFRINSAENKILGGNLSLISSLVGTKYLPEFKGSKLFLEDCKEDAYKLDRMFHQLDLAGILNGIKELWLGLPLETAYNIAHLQSLAAKHSFILKTNLEMGHGETKLSLALG
jgi:muramoyltetrapeptide carboxypeptidase